MTDNNDHRWWFIMIDNDRSWLIDWLIDYRIMITRSVIITTVSRLCRPTGLLFANNGCMAFVADYIVFDEMNNIFQASMS